MANILAISQSRQAAWVMAEWILLATWVTACLAAMEPSFGKAIHLYGGLFTSYAADLTHPPWLYIGLRRRPVYAWARWVSSSPELVASSIFLAGALYEVSQVFWPEGVFGGIFDPLDIVVYGAGLSVCYVADKRGLREFL